MSHSPLLPLFSVPLRGLKLFTTGIQQYPCGRSAKSRVERLNETYRLDWNFERAVSDVFNVHPHSSHFTCVYADLLDFKYCYYSVSFISSDLGS